MNRLYIFDIIRQKFVYHATINPPTANLKYLYEDESGGKKYLLCRTSDLHKSKANIEPFFQEIYTSLIDNWREGGEFHQDIDEVDMEQQLEKQLSHSKNDFNERTKLTLVTYFNDRMGRITFQEYLLTNSLEKTDLQIISTKEIFFSK